MTATACASPATTGYRDGISRDGRGDRQFTIRDLTERRRTYVNQMPVAEQVLAHGDEIRIGRSVFLFLAEGQPAPARPPTVDLDEGSDVGGSQRTARKGDALYLDRGTLLDQVATRIRPSTRPPRKALSFTRDSLASVRCHSSTRDISVDVWCKGGAGSDGASVRYAIVITIEAGDGAPRLRTDPRAPARASTSARLIWHYFS